ncbi:MAG: indole-3-glycerol phosphate synthase TrpC [Dehalococcoidia bacterium]|nr:indole-3-glycerol phosphate synthase TrpC [Dehalococcoidia bacterium]
MNNDFLSGIVARTIEEVAAAKTKVSIEEMKARALDLAAPLSLAQVLRGFRIKVIAEIKRASPSRGPLRPDLDPAALAWSYVENGAAAISVLTETSSFGGSLEDLRAAKKGLKGRLVPLLRKDFIIDPYQVYQTRAFGADAMLLIAAILEGEKLAELLHLSYDLGMRCLVEVHNEVEAERAATLRAGIVGINNRDLRTFEVDINTTARLRKLIPPDRIVVSESGIRTREDLQKLSGWKVQAALVGESLVTAPDPGAALRELTRSE